MDPLSQGLVGATASSVVSERREKLEAAAIGFGAGLAADIDVLIRSSVDPLLFLEYHRHFTHALLFIPIGAAICAALYVGLKRLFGSRAQTSMAFKRVYLFAFAGYATHALLDSCTTYGTQLFLPFSDVRVAWNNVSVIDPLFTLPLLGLLVVALLRSSTRLASIAAVYALSYLALGLVQQQRAELVALELAESRGHQPVALGLKPSFANILVWKSVYQHNGSYYVDAIRAGFEAKVYEGESTPVLSVSSHFPWLDPQSQQATDIERFRWFSNDHLGVDPENPNRIIDVRYSLIPNQLSGMWGIELNPNAAFSDFVQFNTSRPQGEELQAEAQRLWQMVLGR